MPGELIKTLVELNRDDALKIVKNKIERGDDPIKILEECREGMTVVGDLFKKGEYYLAEMMLSAEIFKAAMIVLDPYLSKSKPVEPLDKVVLATLKGDIHDLGKNILATLLRAQGFEVHDLGVDIAPPLVIEKVKEIKPGFVGFSALITSAFDSMKEASEMIEEAGLRDNLKLMVGGGVTTPTVKDYLKADFQTTDAVKGVDYCMNIVKGGN